VGEKLEITSKVYLSPFGITRAEEVLYLLNAQMRTLFGKTNVNAMSRFINEIPEELLESLNERAKSFSPSAQSSRPVKRSMVTRSALSSTGGDAIGWQVGDKAEHKKWGVGTVVSVKGEGDSKELDIAFPSPTGVKRLLAKFAPVTKV
jgi:DNA helicase-2/ATP-dependent DNA helicase PcrA